MQLSVLLIVFINSSLFITLYPTHVVSFHILSYLLVWNLIVSSLFVPLHCFWFSYSYIHHFSSVWSVHKLPSISFAFIYSFLSILFTFLIHSLISFYSSSVLIFIISLSTHVPLCSQSVPLARLSTPLLPLRCHPALAFLVAIHAVLQVSSGLHPTASHL